MAEWQDVKDFLIENYEKDFGMSILAGPDGYAAVVQTDSFREVVLVFNDSPIVTVAAIICDTSQATFEQIWNAQTTIGVGLTNDSYMLRNLSVMQTLDAADLQVPMYLVASSAHKIRTALGL